MERGDILKGLFADPTLKAEKGFFLTSDNQAFSEGHKTDGVNHAKALENSSLEWFDRSSVVKGETEEGGTEQIPAVVASAKPKTPKVKKGEVKEGETEEVKEGGTEEEKTEEVPAVDASAPESDILQ